MNNILMILKKTTLLSFTVLLSLYSNAQSFTEDSSISLPGLEQGSATWADVDNDGDLDILLKGKSANNTYYAGIYINNGDGTFAEQTNTAIKGSKQSPVAWGDYNNDGYADFVMENRETDSDIKTRLFVNNQSGDFTLYPDQEFGEINLGVVKFIDINNDGRQDIATSGNSTNLFLNNKTDFTDVTGNNFSDFEYEQQVAWGDYDNDGYVDMIGTSVTSQNILLFINNGDIRFTKSSASFDYLFHGMFAWGDYDNDGDLDILLTGFNSIYKTLLYRNNGDGSFSKQSMAFAGVQRGYVAWGDYNNDGYLDVIISGMGSSTKIYKNNGNNTFTSLTDIQLPYSEDGATTWGDYDNDGDLDLLFTGEGITRIYKNNATQSNEAPEVPGNLSVQQNGDNMQLQWDAPSDDTTPSVALSYSVRVGTTPGACDIVSPMSLADGFRQLSEMGNAELDTFFILNGLEPGTYYWSVQAIDNGYTGGAFAEEQSFTISGTSNVINSQLNAPAVFPNPASSHINIECNSLMNATIVSQSGACVVKSNNTLIDISHLPAGLYIVSIKTALGTTQRKLVKK